MGRRTSFGVDGMKQGEWTAEEDQKLVTYINEHGTNHWGFLPKRAGLQRFGKSCRLRWLNYLRPGITRGKFTPQEEEDIIKFHALLGNRWASIAKQMQSRTDNDIKNHWHSCLKKRLSRKGLDPMTHEPIINNLTVKSKTTTTTNEDCNSSSSSGSARLLNKLAASISSTRHNLYKIKNILSDSKTTSSDQEEVLNKDEKDQEDDFPMWNEEQLRLFMEIDEMDYETTLSYGSFAFLESSLSPGPYGIDLPLSLVGE